MDRLNQLIALAAGQVKFGKLDIDLEVHNGKVTSMVGSEHMEKHYLGQGNEAIEELQMIVANEKQAGKSGLITFTLDIKSGNIKKMFVHRQFKHMLDNT